MTDLTLTCRRTINASPERVYNAWLDPAMMTRFMAPGGDMHISEARSYARAGGRFFVLMVGEKPMPHEGRYITLTPFSRLVFTWEAPWSAPDTQVEIQLTPVGAGTEIVLTQVKFMSGQSRDGHKQGWDAILTKLAEVLG